MVILTLLPLQETMMSFENDILYRYLLQLDMTISCPQMSFKNKDNERTVCSSVTCWGTGCWRFSPCCLQRRGFFIWNCRKQNFQNDPVRAISVSEIDKEERYRDMTAHSDCIGLFVCFTEKKLMCILNKDVNMCFLSWRTNKMCWTPHKWRSPWRSSALQVIYHSGADEAWKNWFFDATLMTWILAKTLVRLLKTDRKHDKSTWQQEYQREGN